MQYSFVATTLKFNPRNRPNMQFILEKYLKDNNIPACDFLIYATPGSTHKNRIRFLNGSDALAAKLTLSFLS